MKNSNGGISDLQISGQSLIKENCHKSRSSNDIDINLGTITKFDKIKKTMSKKLDDDVILANYKVIAIFSN